MSKTNYRYNPKSLSYEKVDLKPKDIILKVLSYLATGLVFATITILLAYKFLPSPSEKKKNREIELVLLQYDVLKNKMDNLEKVITDLEDRDNNVYRLIFESEPIPAEIRKAGFGGVDRYKKLEGYDNSELMIETTKRLDQLTKRIYVQSKSYDEVVKMVKNKEQLLNSIPAIMPINSKFLKNPPSGFGYRTHPIYKTQIFHKGMDFTAPTGTPIYATGDGIVEAVELNDAGYGNHVILNHGFGYQTLYAHMVTVKTQKGKKIKRGELIGLVGNTGLSTGPHVHYEVHKNGNHLNPISFYYSDLNPEQYQNLLDISSRSTQSFD